MGEYWKPVNIDKRQQVHPHRVGDGLKLAEWFAWPGADEDQSATKRTVMRLIDEGIWSREDEIRVVSDYGGRLDWLGPSTDRPGAYQDEWEDADRLLGGPAQPERGGFGRRNKETR